MQKIITIGGSTSKNSINKILAEYVANLVINVEVVNIDLNDYLVPIYSIDIEESEGIPKKILELNSIFDSSDGFVVSLAEHNGAYSAAFKNVFDWLSRVNKYVWRNVPMLLMATSPGARGGATVLEIAKNSFPHLGGVIVGSLAFPSFYDNLKDGKIVNEALNTNVEQLITDFEKKLNE